MTVFVCRSQSQMGIIELTWKRQISCSLPGGLSVVVGDRVFTWVVDVSFCCFSGNISVLGVCSSLSPIDGPRAAFPYGTKRLKSGLSAKFCWHSCVCSSCEKSMPAGDTTVQRVRMWMFLTKELLSASLMLLKADITKPAEKVLP